MSSINTELIKEAEAAHQFQSSFYFQLLGLGHRLAEKLYLRNLIPHYEEALRFGDKATVSEIESAFNNATGLESALTAAVSSAMTILDPVGAAYTYFTGKNTMGGFSLQNENLEGEKLFTPKSFSTYAGKACGYAAGALLWIAFPVAMGIAAVAAPCADYLIARYQQTERESALALAERSKKMVYALDRTIAKIPEDKRE